MQTLSPEILILILIQWSLVTNQEHMFLFTPFSLHLINTYLILINHVTSIYLNPQCKYLHVSIFACSVIVFFKHEAQGILSELHN